MEVDFVFFAKWVVGKRCLKGHFRVQSLPQGGWPRPPSRMYILPPSWMYILPQSRMYILDVHPGCTRCNMHVVCMLQYESCTSWMYMLQHACCVHVAIWIIRVYMWVKPHGWMQVLALPLVEFGVLLSYDPWTPGG